MKVVKEIASPKYVVEEAEETIDNGAISNVQWYGIKGFDNLSDAEEYAAKKVRDRPATRYRIIEN